MDSMTLFIASLAVSCIGALASVLLIKADNAAKTAGCLIGAGIGIVMRAGASTGGMDIPALILKKIKNVNPCKKGMDIS